MYSKLLTSKHIELSNIKNILIFFFVFSLIFSRFLADLIVVFSSIAFVYFKIKKKIEFHSNFFFFFCNFLYLSFTQLFFFRSSSYIPQNFIAIH